VKSYYASIDHLMLRDRPRVLNASGGSNSPSQAHQNPCRAGTGLNGRHLALAGGCAVSKAEIIDGELPSPAYEAAGI